jgi:uncharacterized protein with PQ loop repeat
MGLADILLYAAGLIWGCDTLAQIIKTLKAKSTKGVSYIYFYLSWFAYVIYIIGNYMLENWIVVYSHIPGLIGTSVILLLLWKYRKQ